MMSPVRENDPELLAALVGRLEKTVEAGFEEMRREFRDQGTRLANLEEWKAGVLAVEDDRRKVAVEREAQETRERAYKRDAQVVQWRDAAKIAALMLTVLAAFLGVVAGALGLIGIL